MSDTRGAPHERGWRRPEVIVGIIGAAIGAISIAITVLQLQEGKSAAALPITTPAGIDGTHSAKKNILPDTRECLIGTWNLSRWRVIVNASQFILDTPGTVDLITTDISTGILQFNDDGSGSQTEKMTLSGYGNADRNFYSITTNEQFTFRFTVSGTTISYGSPVGSAVVDSSINHEFLGRQTVHGRLDPDSFTCSDDRLTLSSSGYSAEYERG